MKIFNRPVYMYILMSVLLGVTFAFLPIKETSALSGAEFKPGRIIDDNVFYNSNTMDAAQIQRFLNAKVPVCDTNHSRTSDPNDSGPPYTCLKDYRQNTSNIAPESGLCNGYSGAPNESAAEIIFKVSISCGINPQVLLVMLQKEQSLVTDTWPWNIQYQKAMGAFCPDTAPCDPTYSGFFYQVYYGAHRFKVYAANPGSFNYRAGRNNYVQFHPNTNCGGSTIYIENQATANLYIYTPYQPNQPALNNLYGTGDGCSAYGNRNFWRMFNDWFGPTVGPLIRAIESPALFYTDGVKKYPVSSMQLANDYGLTLNDVRYMWQEEINKIPTASSPLSLVIKSDSDNDADGGALYLVSKGRKHQFTSMGQLSAFGFTESQITRMPLNNLHRLQSSGSLSDYVQLPNNFVQKIESQTKRGIFDLGTLQSVNTGGSVTPVNDFTLSHLPVGQPVINNDAILRQSNGKSWLYQNNIWYYIPSIDVYNCWNFSSISNFTITNSQAVPPSSVTNLTCQAELSNGTKFLMNRTNRIPIQVGWGLTQFSKTLDRTINRIPVQNIPAGSLFKSASSSTLYTFETNKKRPLASMQVLQEFGFNQSNIQTVQNGIISGVETGVTKFNSGIVIKNSSGQIFVTNADKKLYIPNVSTLESYGYDANKAVTNTSVLNQYTTDGNLASRYTIGSTGYLTDNKRLLRVADADKTHFGITSSTPRYNVYMLNGLRSEVSASRFVKAKNSSTIFYLENGSKRPISSWSKLLSLGGNNDSIQELLTETMNIFPSGPAI